MTIFFFEGSQRRPYDADSILCSMQRRTLHNQKVMSRHPTKDHMTMRFVETLVLHEMFSRPIDQSIQQELSVNLFGTRLMAPTRFLPPAERCTAVIKLQKSIKRKGGLNSRESLRYRHASHHTRTHVGCYCPPLPPSLPSSRLPLPLPPPLPPPTCAWTSFCSAAIFSSVESSRPTPPMLSIKSVFSPAYRRNGDLGRARAGAATVAVAAPCVFTAGGRRHYSSGGGRY